MKKYFCNPVNIDYHFQIVKDFRGSGDIHVSREAADPTFLYWKGKYYIFASMNLSVWVSSDLAEWKSVRLPDNLPLYDYAPDVRVIGEYVYFSASKRGEICNYYRTKDIENGPYEEIEGTFDFWDPDLFVDDDGKVYFYWGCANTTPIWGVELDPQTMKPKTDRIELIHGNPKEIGYERVGEDHCKNVIEGEELDKAFEAMIDQIGRENFEHVPAEDKAFFKGMLSNMPFIEGAYMNKHNGKYYLQYACPGAEYNVYCDGVYVSDSPLGPFRLAKNNPFSYQPGGFIPGAGHGSTMEDAAGNLWHASTSRISLNDGMERRVGIWPAGFDEDGDLFCNTAYGDWPRFVDGNKIDPWQDPEWFLLSRGAKVTASSYCTGTGEKAAGIEDDCEVAKWDSISPAEDNSPQRASEENVRTWWRAATGKDGEWLLMDLGEEKEIHGIQINFADDKTDIGNVEEAFSKAIGNRVIDEHVHRTRWTLYASKDGENFTVITDKSDAETNLGHDFVIVKGDEGEASGAMYRFIKLVIHEVPFGLPAAVSGLRVFGKGNGQAPGRVKAGAVRISDLDMNVTLTSDGADGYNIKWGYKKDKLYHSAIFFPEKGAQGEVSRKIGALMKGEPVFVQVDAFNENGITKGEVQEVL